MHSHIPLVVHHDVQGLAQPRIRPRLRHPVLRGRLGIQGPRPHPHTETLWLCWLVRPFSPPCPPLTPPQPRRRLCPQPPGQHPAVSGPAQHLCRSVVPVLLPAPSQPLPVLYTIGILVSLAGTGFLIGVSQTISPLLLSLISTTVCKPTETGNSVSPVLPPLTSQKMFKPVRIIATVAFLASIALVFVGAFVIGSEVCPPSPFSLLSRSRAAGPLHRQVPPYTAAANSPLSSVRRHRVPCIHLVLSVVHPLCPLCRFEGRRAQLDA